MGEREDGGEGGGEDTATAEVNTTEGTVEVGGGGDRVREGVVIAAPWLSLSAIGLYENACRLVKWE